MQLQQDSISGIRIKPGICLNRRTLGFTFNSNALGLRGPSACNGKGVIFGTSFAMGFAVDVGYNWYDYCVPTQSWLNLGFPVGTEQLENLLNFYYRGSASVAIVLHFPNIWELTGKFNNWSVSGVPIFHYLNWETAWWKCYLLYIKKKKELLNHLQDGNAIIYNNNGVNYHINCKYALFDFENDLDTVKKTVACWKRLLSGFQSTIFIRIPLKQELLPENAENNTLKLTKINYDIGWNIIKEGLKCNPQIDFVKLNNFNLNDFHPWDIHWNARGNEKFGKLLLDILNERLT